MDSRGISMFEIVLRGLYKTVLVSILKIVTFFHSSSKNGFEYNNFRCQATGSHDQFSVCKLGYTYC